MAVCGSESCQTTVCKSLAPIVHMYVYIYLYMYTMYDIHRLIYFCMRYIYIKIKVIHYIFVDLCCRLFWKNYGQPFGIHQTLTRFCCSSLVCYNCNNCNKMYLACSCQ